jgi:NADPH dehydrogenase (quinone)
MKTKVLLIMLVTMLAAGLNAEAQTTPSKATSKQKTVLLINAHLRYPGMSREN